MIYPISSKPELETPWGNIWKAVYMVYVFHNHSPISSGTVIPNIASRDLLSASLVVSEKILPFCIILMFKVKSCILLCLCSYIADVLALDLVSGIMFFDTARIVCRARSMKLLSVHHLTTICRCGRHTRLWWVCCCWSGSCPVLGCKWEQCHIVCWHRKLLNTDLFWTELFNNAVYVCEWFVSQVVAACSILQQAKSKLSALAGSGIDIHVSHVDHFYDRVLIACVDQSPALKDYAGAVRFLLADFIADSFDFKPHLTILKLTRSNDRLVGCNKVPRWLYSEFKNKDFGRQPVSTIDLCAMSHHIERPEGEFYVTPLHMDIL